MAASVLSLSVPAAAEVTRISDDSFVSRHEAVVDASPKEVWLALITPAGWWRKEHTWSGDAANLVLTPQAGGCFCETIPAIDEPKRFTLEGSVEHMRVVQAYPETALRMLGALGPLQSEPVTGVLTITISPVGQGTRIVWEYNVGGPMRYEVAVISKAVDGVMGLQVAALSKLLGPAETALEEPAPDAADAKETPVPDAATPPTIRPAPVLTSQPPAPRPSSAQSATPRPGTPVTKPPAKTDTVDDAFGDLKDNKRRS